MKKLEENIEDLESIKRGRINKLQYCCQCSRDTEEILLEDIGAEFNI